MNGKKSTNLVLLGLVWLCLVISHAFEFGWILRAFAGGIIGLLVSRIVYYKETDREDMWKKM